MGHCAGASPAGNPAAAAGRGSEGQLQAELDAAYKMLNAALEGRKAAEDQAKELQVGAAHPVLRPPLHLVIISRCTQCPACTHFPQKCIGRLGSACGVAQCAVHCLQAQLVAEKQARKAAQKQSDDLAAELKVGSTY